MNSTKKAVLHRDNYKCNDCNLSKKSLTIHHIRELSKHPELKFKRSNLVTLCQSCHKRKHSKNMLQSALKAMVLHQNAQVPVTAISLNGCGDPTAAPVEQTIIFALRGELLIDLSKQLIVFHMAFVIIYTHASHVMSIMQSA